MEGKALSLAEYVRAHPDVSICRVDGVLYAWAPGWCPQVGRAAHGDTEDELLAKLDG